MPPKIERAWGMIFGQSPIKRKETTDRDPSQGQGYDHQGGASNQKNPEQKDDQQAAPKADRAAVEKAIADLRESAYFSETGMRVEFVNTKDGIVVRLTNAAGALVKEMSGDELCRLRDTAGARESTRGKILDQKF